MNVYSSSIHNSRNVETTQMLSTDEWINKMWFTHTMEYYLATERNEVLIHVATWMNLIHIMWNERNQTHKRLRIAWFHLKETFGTDQSIETESTFLLISWLQSLSSVILEPKKIKSATVYTFPPSICHEMMGPVAMILVFWMLSFKPTFFTLLFHLQEALQFLFPFCH